MEQKTVNIDNFIGVYDNYITHEMCNNSISIYESQNKFNNKNSRIFVRHILVISSIKYLVA